MMSRCQFALRWLTINQIGENKISAKSCLVVFNGDIIISRYHFRENFASLTTKNNLNNFNLKNIVHYNLRRVRCRSISGATYSD